MRQSLKRVRAARVKASRSGWMRKAHVDAESSGGYRKGKSDGDDMATGQALQTLNPQKVKQLRTTNKQDDIKEQHSTQGPNKTVLSQLLFTPKKNGTQCKNSKNSKRV